MFCKPSDAAGVLDTDYCSIGFSKKAELFWFFEIVDAKDFRIKLKDVVPLIKTSADAQQNRARIIKHKKSDAAGLVRVAQANIAFSKAGLKKVS